MTGVEEVHKIAGEDCFLVKIRAEGTGELGVVLDTEINPIPTVARVSCDFGGEFGVDKRDAFETGSEKS